MILFCLPNVSSQEAERLDVEGPPTLDGPGRPKFKNKEQFRTWCKSAKTRHAFLNVAEGLSPKRRVTAANPPAFVHGIIAEYDADGIGNDWLERLANKGPIAPNWVCRTFSNNVRAYWFFDKPLAFHNAKLHKAFLQIAFAELMCKMLCPGFEPEETSDPARYFELGTEWTLLNPDPLPLEQVAGWMVRASEKHDWSKEGTAVPIHLVREVLEKKYPGAWRGGWNRFDLGARGHRFWAPDADADAVLVTETGLVCFTGDERFKPWGDRDLCGAAWVRKVTDSKIGTAVNGMYYDSSSKLYWANSSAVGWMEINTESMKLRLSEAGLSKVVPKGETQSEQDRAVLALQQTRCLHGAFPGWHRPQEILHINGKKFLNTSSLKLWPASPEPNPNGEGFPWIKKFLTLLFADQYDIYIHWLAHFYQCCLAGNPVRGLVLFVAGPSGVGKTFLNQFLHRAIFGMCSDATAFLTRQDQFNRELLHAPFWRSDDIVASGDSRANMIWSQALKALAANDGILMRGMFAEGKTMVWPGRLCVTMNDDPESLRMLPSTEINAQDKFMLLKAHKTFDVFPADDEIEPELSAFCAYLRDLPRNPKIWVGGRFGIKAYHDPELFDAAEQAQDSTHALDLFRRWARYYFSPQGDGAKSNEWCGTPGDLIGEFEQYADIKSQASRLLPTASIMGRALVKLINRGVHGVGQRWTKSHRNQYVIERSIID